MSKSTMKTNWNELRVSDAEGDSWGKLGALVADAPANLDSATITNGEITEWPGFFLSVDGEDPNWDTPACEIDWTGFTTALKTARGAELI
jgi:hypothetical protein